MVDEEIVTEASFTLINHPKTEIHDGRLGKIPKVLVRVIPVVLAAVIGFVIGRTWRSGRINSLISSDFAVGVNPSIEQYLSAVENAWLHYNKTEGFRTYLSLPVNSDYHKSWNTGLNRSTCRDVPLELRFDCFPEPGAQENACIARGCCWQVINEANLPPRRVRHPRRHYNSSTASEVPLNLPFCYYPPSYEGYSFSSVNETQCEGITATMVRETESGFPSDIRRLKFDVVYATDAQIHVKIYDPSSSRWEPPLPITKPMTKHGCDKLYSVDIQKSTGTFSITRCSTKQPIFDTQLVAPLVFSDQFLQISTKLASPFLFGLGEHLDGLLLDTYWTRHVLWNLDQVPEEGKNLYGSHPFFMVKEPSGLFHGVFVHTSNALDVVLQPTPALTFHIIGGILDIHIFLGPSPFEVIEQYTGLIGKPVLPPYWSLGYHQCRFGYKTLSNMESVLNRTIAAGIPIDVQWNDIDYMKSNNDFTYNASAYEGLPEFLHKLHESGMHYIPIIDPGISASEPVGTYPPYDEGIKMDIFVHNSSDMPVLGKVWNRGLTTWPDFTNSNSFNYWYKQLKRYHDIVPYDGVWIDMNEPSNFWSGHSPVDGCSPNKLNYPYYIPHVHGNELFYHTLCMDDKHAVGFHYNVHNLYAFSEAISTNVALMVIRGKRPFIISRATYPGQGAVAGHWTGDVISDFYNMERSIPTILNMNIFGIPMVGADICGFNGNTTAELCGLWMQLGSFYPFCRNHNTDDAIDQDPVAMGEEVVAMSRFALMQRYKLLPYLYTLFFQAHLTGRPVAIPLFFLDPLDEESYFIEDQFMWGKGLMIAAVLEPPKQGSWPHDMTVYFPTGRSYDWYTGKLVEESGRTYKNVTIPQYHIPLFVTGGSILPWQVPENTTTYSRRNPFNLVAALSSSERAVGELFWDDGDSLNTVERGDYVHIQFEATANGLRVEKIFFRRPIKNAITLDLETVKVLGVSNRITKVTVNQQNFTSFTYREDIKVLEITAIHKSLYEQLVFEWS